MSRVTKISTVPSKSPPSLIMKLTLSATVTAGVNSVIVTLSMSMNSPTVYDAPPVTVLTTS